MIGLVRDKDLRDGRPILIIYTLNRDRSRGFIIKIGVNHCNVKPYIYDIHFGVRYGIGYKIKYSEISKFIEENDREGLYRYLYNKLHERRINRF